jgi:hypothetical protein
MALIRHGTLTAATVATVTLTTTGDSIETVEVLNRSGGAEIYFRTDGTAPTVGGDDCEVLPASIGGVEVSVAPQESLTVKLISSAAEDYTVRAG